MNIFEFGILQYCNETAPKYTLKKLAPLAPLHFAITHACFICSCLAHRKIYPHLRLQDSGAQVLNRTLKSVVRSIGETLYGWDEHVMKYFSMQRILLGIRWRDAMYTEEIVARQKLGARIGFEGSAKFEQYVGNIRTICLCCIPTK